jgi:hypothetical protein
MRWLTFLAALLVIGLLSNPSSANKGVFASLEERLLFSDFVGIVECQTAGGIVAKYRVVESFRGSKAGSDLTIAMDINFWATQYPLALCKERYLVAARKEDSPDPNMISASGGALPLKWRKIPTDFHIPLFSGHHEHLKPGYEKDPAIMQELDFARRLLSGVPAEQELALLRALVSRTKPFQGMKGDEAALARKRNDCDRLLGQPTVTALNDQLARLAEQDPQNWSVDAAKILKDYARLLERLKERKNPSPRLPQRGLEAKNADQPSVEELARSRSILLDKAGRDARAFDQAFSLLTRHDPDFVATYLRNGSFPFFFESPVPLEKREKSRAYVLGSRFCVGCTGNREQHLTTLLRSREDFIRVAAAVYLCFENERAGVAELRKLLPLPEEPGAWAALTLARRGYKEAMPRLLEHYLRKRQTVLYESKELKETNLDPRIVELLSNSARAAGVPQPPEQQDDREAARQAEPQRDRLALQEWWKQYESRISLRDPWLEVLAAQKID